MQRRFAWSLSFAAAGCRYAFIAVSSLIIGRYRRFRERRRKHECCDRGIR